MPTTASRLILHLSRLKIAVPAASLVRRGCPAPAASSGWAVGAEEARHDVDRCLLAAPGARSSRILFHLSRLMVAVPAANLVTCGCRAGQRLGSGQGLGRWSALRRRPLPSRYTGARERRGAACDDLLPDTFSPFPVNGCRSGRELGWLLLKGGNGWAVGGQWALGSDEKSTAAFPRRRALASGEERLVRLSSRIFIRFSRLMDAVPAANLVSCC